MSLIRTKARKGTEGDSPLGVFSVSDRVTDNVLKEDLEDTTGLLVDETGDTLHTTTTSETADSGLGDTYMQGKPLVNTRFLIGVP